MPRPRMRSTEPPSAAKAGPSHKPSSRSPSAATTRQGGRVSAATISAPRRASAATASGRSRKLDAIAGSSACATATGTIHMRSTRSSGVA